MASFLSSLLPLEVFFLACGLIGSAFVIFQLALQFLGGDADLGDGGDLPGDVGGDLGGDVGGDLVGDGGGDMGGDMDGDAGDHSAEDRHDDTDVHFKLLSIQGLSAFLMMFGFVALAIHRDTSSGVFLAIVGGSLAGLLSVWVIKKLYQFLHSLQSSGTMGIADSLGSRGTVYVRIPEGGVGQVQIILNERVREYDATSRDRQPIKAGTPIEVVGVSGDMLIVLPVEMG